MILSAIGIKASGATSGEIWYVTGQYHSENGMPIISMSRNRSRAFDFETKKQADDFNEKFMRIGQIDKPFNVSY